MPAKLILTATAVALIVAAGIVAVDAGVAETGDVRTFSEDFSGPTAGSQIVLNQSQLDSVRYLPADNLNVTDENGTLMIPGEDFSYNRSAGTITPLAGGRLAGDADGHIDYGFRFATGQQTGVAETGSSVADVAVLFVWVTTVGFIVVSLRAFEVI